MNKVLKKYDDPGINIMRFSSEYIVTDSNILKSLEDKGLTSEKTVKIDFMEMLEMKR